MSEGRNRLVAKSRERGGGGKFTSAQGRSETFTLGKDVIHILQDKRDRMHTKPWN